ncbi:transporter substrate-binding domain-containing protein [Thiospirochaeta perfilievii]|uniref:Transporter substrate-binding domain-containing protein n=1 Tax=Thiospirochaeta perfilievii TaxID=252967 RepID=A0A5C1QCF2_9SPIO|nr:transporter substrate-binding domain-containing protein [Thiospirochaeta perfilievii]
MRRYISAAFIFLFSINILYSDAIFIGVASEFPPYQFNVEGKVTGFDVDVANLLFFKMGIDIIFVQDEWDRVFNMLRAGTIDAIVGIENNEIRRIYFEFSKAYYTREDVLFVRADNTEIKTLDDLTNKIITGDRHSYIELDWIEEGIINKFRIRQTESKSDSM